MFKHNLIAAFGCLVLAMASAVGWGYVQAQAPGEKRFDELVRADFFAGVAGDAAAFERAMRLIDSTLAQNPRHPEALVWHGSGLLARATRSFQKGDATAGVGLWTRG